MSVAEHNPSRRALLGAAAALPLIGPFLLSSFSRKRESTSTAASGSWTPAQVRGDGKWERALAAFRVAEAALGECARRTAGATLASAGGWAGLDAIEEEYGDRLDALYAALKRLLRAPAPDFAAFATKVALAIEHEAATLTGGEACLAVVRREALRLAHR